MTTDHPSDDKNPFMAAVRRQGGQPEGMMMSGPPRSPDEAQLVAKTRLAGLQQLSTFARASFAEDRAKRLASEGLERLLEFEESAADMESRIAALPERSQKRMAMLADALAVELGENVIRIGDAAAYGMAEIASRAIEVDPPKKPGILDTLLGA